MPAITYFKPAGIPMRLLEEVCLSVEEAEAIRLKDLEGLEQQESAERMKISRPTFHRVLASARKKIADSLLNGKAIRIEGGNFEIAEAKFRCCKGHEWEAPAESGEGVEPGVCPRCGNPDIQPLQPGFCGRGWKRGWGRARTGLPKDADADQVNHEPKESTDGDTG